MALLTNLQKKNTKTQQNKPAASLANNEQHYSGFLGKFQAGNAKQTQTVPQYEDMPQYGELPWEKQQKQPETKTYQYGDWLPGGGGFYTYTGDMGKPFEQDYLNEQYKSNVQRLNAANKSGNKKPEEVLRDSFLLTNDFWNFTRETVALHGQAQKNYDEERNQKLLDASSRNLNSALMKKEAEYRTAGISAQEQKDQLTAMGYESETERDRREEAARKQEMETRDSYAQYQREVEKAWEEEHGKEQKEKEARAEFYRNLPTLIEKETKGDLRFDDPELESLWAETVNAMPDDILMRVDGALWGEQQGDDQSAIQAYFQALADAEQPRETAAAPELTAEGYRDWIAQNDAYAGEAQAENWLDWAKEHRDQRGNMLRVMEKMAATPTAQNSIDLTEDEIELLGTVRRNMPEGVQDAAQRVLWGVAEPGDMEKVQEYARQAAGMLRGTADVYGDNPEYSEEVKALLEQYWQTPEGAREHLEDVKGTGEEQQARDNLYYAENRAKYAQVPQAEDFEENSQPQEEKNTSGLYAAIAGLKPKSILGQGEYDSARGNLLYTMPEERKIFLYLYNTQGEKAAREYWQYLQYTIDERKTNFNSQTTKNLAKSRPDYAAYMTMLDVADNYTPILAYGDIASQRIRQLTGLQNTPVNRNTMPNQLRSEQAAAEEGIMENINLPVNIFGREIDLADFLFGTGKSGLKSLLTGVTGQSLGQMLGGSAEAIEKIAEWSSAILMGSGSAQSAMKDVYDRDGNDDQALFAGLMNGIFETLFEKVSFSQLFENAKYMKKDDLVSELKRIATSTFTNAAEEFNTSVADTLADVFIMGDKSEYGELVTYYKDHGLDKPGEAEARAFWDMAMKAGEEGAGGALMGTWFEMQSAATRTANRKGFEKSTGQSIIQAGTQQTLKDIGMTMPEGSKARKAAESFQPGKAKAKDVGALYREIYTMLSGSKKLQQAMKDRMTRDVAAKMTSSAAADGGAAASAIVSLYSGEEITPEQAQAIAKNQGAMAAMRELMGVEDAKAEEAAPKETKTEEAQKETDEAAEAEAEAREAEGRDLFAQANAAIDARRQTLEDKAVNGQVQTANRQQEAAPAEERETGRNSEARRQTLEDKAVNGQVQTDNRQQEAAPAEERETGQNAEARRQTLEDKAVNGQVQAANQQQEAAPAEERETGRNSEARRQTLEDKAVNRQGQTMREEEATPTEQRQTGQNSEARRQVLEDKMVNRQGQTVREEEATPTEQRQTGEGNAARRQVLEDKSVNRQPIMEVKSEGKPAQVETVTEDRDGGVTVRLADGQEKSLDEIDADDNQKELLNQSSSLPAEDAPGLVNNYQEGQDAQTYGIGYKRIYNGAKRGQTLDEIHSVFGKSELTDAQQRAAWEAGKRAAARAQQAAAQKNAALAQKEGFQTLDTENGKQTGVIFAGVTKALSKSARKQLQMIELFARAHGLQVRVYDTLGEDNGSYKTGTNIINVALDADAGALTRTVSHEGYHFLKNWNAEAAQKIQALVIDTLRNTEGYDLDRRVKAIMEKYGLKEDDALEEITADAMLDVIGKEDTLNRLLKEDKGLARKILDWLADVIGELRGMLEKLGKYNPEVKAMLGQQIETLEGLQRQYLDGLQKAEENYRAAQEGATRSAQENKNVKDYMEAMQGGEDRQTALNGLISQLFFTTQREWLQAHPDADLDEALQRFADVLMQYRKENTALRPILENAGFAAPRDMTALSYAADQLVGMERDKGETEVNFQPDQKDVDALDADLQMANGDETEYGTQKKFSKRVTDRDELDFLNNQDTVKTYKTMQLVDGKLYPPMAAVVAGSMEDYSVLGQWEKATEHPELIKDGNKFTLNKGRGKGSLAAAYNPYMHSSNLMINDQFSGAYNRPELVTVECEVPKSEMDSGYHAQYAKDSVGWHSWHTGTVAGQLRNQKGTERKVFLSRWIKPVRIISNAEVAQHYAGLLAGTDIQVPDNVVTPALLEELRKAGVPIKESGRVQNEQGGVKYNKKLGIGAEEVTLPSLNLDPAYAFKGTDAEVDAADRKVADRQAEIRDIIQAPGFRGLQITKPNGQTEILTPSIRPGVKWQLSYYGTDGIANMHENYGQTGAEPVNEAIHTEDELYRHFANMTLRRDLTMELLGDDTKHSRKGSDQEQTETENFKRWFGNSQMKNTDGKPKVFYHGTNSGKFEVFDKNLIGKAREGDVGFFGRGFYFAFSEGEAAMYGKDVMPVYLKIEKPFNFTNELLTYKGKAGNSLNSANAVFVLNFAEKFPELAKNQKVQIGKRGEETIKDISFAEFAEEYKEIYNKKQFKVEEVEGEYGKEWVVLADPMTETWVDNNGEKHSYSYYDYQQKYVSEKEAKNKNNQTIDYMRNSLYSYMRIPSPAQVIQETDFSEAVKKKGYDGIIQSENGDEAVVFEPTQIKSATENVGTFDPKDPNIKHSRKAEDVVRDVEEDAALYAQVQSDRDAREALGLMQRLDESVRDAAKVAWKERLGAIADKILQETGSDMTKRQLMNRLRTLFTAMDDAQMSLGEKIMYARTVLKDAVRQTGMAMEMDDGTKEALRLIKNRGFFLTDDQKSEIRETYGDVRTYIRKNFGRAAIRAKGSFTMKGSYLSLTDLWGELNEVLPGTFRMDIPEVDMPGILDAFLDSARNRDYSPAFGADAEAYITDAAYRTLLEYYDVPTAFRKTQDIRKEFRQKLEDYKATYKTKQEKKMQASQDRAAATERKNKLRGEISRDVKYLNIRNIAPTDSRHIPQGLREAAIRAVAPFTEANGVWSSEDASRLAREYSMLGDQKANSAMDAARAYDPEIEEKLQHLAQMLDGRRLSELTEAELEDVRDIVGNLKKMIEGANEMHVRGRTTTLDAEGEAFIQAMNERKRIQNKALKKLDDLTYKNMTPAYYADRVGGIIKDMVQELYDGQNKWAFTMKAAKEKAEAIGEEYHLNDWINGPNLEFETQRGDKIELTVGEAMALYATWKRETTNRRQNANHLRIGGFMYGPKADYKGVDTKAPHAVTAADMQKVTEYLGEEKTAYVDAMVKYLSEDMARLGNETSMALYGYEKFGEAYYFPYSSDRNFLSTELTNDSDTPLRQIKNAGFSKATLRNASNPVVLGDFLEIWANHVNQMALYNAFAETTDNMNRLYNYRTSGEVHVDSATGKEHVTAPRSVKQAMEAAMGQGAVKYLQTLVKDVNGGVRADERTVSGKMLSLFKKGSVAANASVTIQQPSAIMRAMNMISPKYFMKQKPGQVSKCIREMNQWSGVAIIKEMGRFDTGTGRGATEWLTDWVKEGNKLKAAYNVMDNLSGWAPEKADQLTWANLWQAVKNEIADRMPELDAGSDDFMRAVAARFEDVVNHTQVYDSTLSKSTLMRSNTLFDKLATSFMAEPTVSFNMLLQGLQNIGKPGGKKAAARALGSFVVASVVNAMLKSLVTAGRRKDDDERTIIEKYLAEVVENAGDDLSPAGIISLVPIARDAVSIFQGYDVNRSDMDVVEQLHNAYKIVMNDNKTFMEKVKAVTGAAGSATGVPAKNVWRDVESILNLLRSAPISETSARDIKYSVLDSLPFGWDSSRSAYYQRINAAAERGDQTAAEEMRGYMTETEGVKEKTMETGLKTAAKNDLLEGRRSGEDTLKLMTGFLGMSENDAYFKMKEWEGGEDYKKYNGLTSAIEKGEGITEAVKELTDHGVKKETISSQLTQEYKQKYIDLYKTNRTAAANLKAALLAALQAAGYDREAKAKAIDKWLEEKKK